MPKQLAPGFRCWRRRKPLQSYRPLQNFRGSDFEDLPQAVKFSLDPAGFGALNIVKAITINGDDFGEEFSCRNHRHNVNTPNTTDVVIIRSISINGAGTGTNGIRFIGRQAYVNNVSISGVATGILADAVGTGRNLFVNDTSIARCTTAGINISTTTWLYCWCL